MESLKQFGLLLIILGCAFWFAVAVSDPNISVDEKLIVSVAEHEWTLGEGPPESMINTVDPGKTEDSIRERLRVEGVSNQDLRFFEITRPHRDMGKFHTWTYPVVTDTKLKLVSLVRRISQ